MSGAQEKSAHSNGRHQERYRMCQEWLIEVIQDIQRRGENDQNDERDEKNEEGVLEAPPDQSPLLQLPQKLSERSLNELIYTINGPEEKKVFVMNLTELQRLNLHALRKRLAAKVFNIVREKSLSDMEATRTQRSISDYCK